MLTTVESRQHAYVYLVSHRTMYIPSCVLLLTLALVGTISYSATQAPSSFCAPVSLEPPVHAKLLF